jgi:phenylacetate-CoA ligase
VPDDVADTRDLLRLPELEKRDVAEHFDRLRDSRPALRRYLRKTSGSTGTPLRLYKDAENLAVMDAVMYRNYRWFGVEMGDPQARFWGAPLAGVGAAKIALRDRLLNRIRFSPFRIADQAYAGHVAALRRFSPTHVYGYAQTIVSFAEYLLKSRTDLRGLRLRAVIMTGEMATRDQVALVESAFGVPVSDEYGCTEVGIIAMGCPEGRMHLMDDYLLVEFVKDGRHVGPGEEGEIVVTELYGSLMPLIRYRIGDVGSYRVDACPCGRSLPLMGHLKGRNDEFILCPDGKRVDPVIFEYALKEMSPRLGRITQFRIIQTRRDHLDIEACYAGQTFADLTKRIEQKLAEWIGNDMSISIRCVESIQPEPSGKLRCFISNLKD